ncbi:MAG: VOC family protein [Terrimicrobiaceae bacterium]|nr:VOC family protein [Terrimicrobiaceae bacterium]
MKWLAGILVGVVWISGAMAQTPSPSPAPTPSSADGLIHLEPKPELLGLVPTFPVLSLNRSVEFYRKLGFNVVLQSGNYVAVGRDIVQIGLVLDRTSTAKGFKISCYIRTGRIDELYKEFLAKGIKPTSDIKTQPSKMREFTVTDPDGFTLIFGEYTGE